MAFCCVFGTGAILGLIDHSLLGLWARTETCRASYKYSTASAGSSAVSAGTGLLAGHQPCPSSKLGGFCTLVLYVHIGSGILRRLETACCFPAAVASGSVQWVFRGGVGED